MISLAYSNSANPLYFLLEDLLIGPPVNLEVDLPSKLERIEEQAGVFHENNVVHDKIVGSLTYDPSLLSAFPGGTTGSPFRITFSAVNYRNRDVTLVAECGFAVPDLVRVKFVNGVTVYHLASFDKVTSKWTITTVQGPTSTGAVVPAGVFQYECVLPVIPYGGGNFYWLSYRKWGIMTESLVDMSGNASAETIRNAAQSGHPVGAVPPFANLLIEAYRGKSNPAVFSPSRIAEEIDMFILRTGLGENASFPLPDMHYGELAMLASEGVNANNVNVIAFLRDLRHPKELVPKLRNLRSIKVAADNYLTVKYGILPTYDDIMSIVQAFRKRRPYVDRNGFSTYSASHRDSLFDGSLTFELEQHAKLAIGDEDSDLQALISRLESMGTLPTFENLWDLVPYSFVIDWLVDVGGFLERVDTRLRLLRLNIRYVTMSRKTIVTGTLVPGSGYPYTGSVSWVHYHRWVSDQCPAPPLSLQTTFQGFNHWLESGALFTQRIKR